jgi:hypothetical protein
MSGVTAGSATLMFLLYARSSLWAFSLPARPSHYDALRSTLNALGQDFFITS